jgi:glycerate kinase
MKIVIAPNSFKECASSSVIAGLIARALKKRGLTDLSVFPVSDGGDGFLDVCSKRFGLTYVSLSVHNCFNGGKKRVKVGYDKRTRRVYIETASVIGLKDAPPEDRRPMKMNSSALGELLRHLMLQNAAGYLPVERIILGIGGTATNDLGLGLCSIFGLKIFDRGGNSLPVYPENYIKVGSIVLPSKTSMEIDAVLDVSVPLTGIDGPAKLFSRQKGAGKKEVMLLEKGTKNILRILKQQYSIDDTEKKLGAGGGLGLGLSLLCRMHVVRSADFLNKTMKLSSVISAGDIVITGEGKYDRQSMMDKATGIVVEEAGAKNKKIFIIAGCFDKKYKFSKNIVPIQMSSFFSGTAESMRNYRKGIDLAVGEIVSRLKT